MDHLSYLAHEGEVDPREGSVHCDDWATCELVSRASFTGRLVLCQAGSVHVIWTRETIRFVFDTNTHQGHMLVEKQNEFIYPVSWLCVVATFCYTSLCSWWRLVVFGAAVLTLPYLARVYNTVQHKQEDRSM